jgi:hypothetical protein
MGVSLLDEAYPKVEKAVTLAHLVTYSKLYIHSTHTNFKLNDCRVTSLRLVHSAIPSSEKCRKLPVKLTFTS